MDDRWAKYCELVDRADALSEDDTVTWQENNRVVDHLYALHGQMLQDRELVDEVRRLRFSSAAAASDTRYAEEFLRSAVELHDPYRLNELWSNPVVGLSKDDLDVQPAVLLWPGEQYYLENETVEEEGPMPGGRPQLTRFGGPAVVIKGAGTSREQLLFQLDLAQLLPDWSEENVPRALSHWPSLPENGLLQLMIRPAGSSAAAQDPLVLRYVPEEGLRRRTFEEATGALAPQVLDLQAGLTSRSAGSESSETDQLEVAWLDDAMLSNRNGVTDDESVAPMRLFGVPHHSTPHVPSERLQQELPLNADSDAHLLLFQIDRSQRYIPDAISGDGWLQVWMRRSDLAKADFNECCVLSESSV